LPNSTKLPCEHVTIISPTSGFTTVSVCLAPGLNSAVAISHPAGIALFGSCSFDCAATPPSGAAHAIVNPMEASRVGASWCFSLEVGCCSAVHLFEL